MCTVFTDKSCAGEWRTIYADSEIFPRCQVAAGLDFQRDTGAVERAGEEEAQALAVGIDMEGALRQHGAGLRRKEAEGKFGRIVKTIIVMVSAELDRKSTRLNSSH